MSFIVWFVEKNRVPIVVDFSSPNTTTMLLGLESLQLLAFYFSIKKSSVEVLIKPNVKKKKNAFSQNSKYVIYDNSIHNTNNIRPY